MKNNYTEKDIQLLSDRDHVRLRLPVYAGSTSVHEYEIPFFDHNNIIFKKVSLIPAVYKCVGEIIDNAIDEFTQSNTTNPQIIIDAQPILGSYSISDNGRGVPIGKHKSGKYTPEVVFGSLRSGRNFTNNKNAGVIGMNGMGSSITCFCSTEFFVDIIRDKKRYRQKFIDGATEISSPIITKTSSTKTGTSISFQLDNTVFSEVSLPPELIQNRAIELALTNPNLSIEHNNKKYKFKNGFNDIIKKLSTKFFKFEQDNIEFYVIFDVHHGIDEKIFSWVNSSFLFDGGLCNTQFLNAFFDKTISHLSKRAKKEKCEVTKNDVRQNLLIFGNLKISDPEYDAQSKTRFIGPNLRKEIVEMINNQWSTFAKKHSAWINTTFENALYRHRVTADKKALKQHTKQIKRKIAGLIDASSKNRFNCQLLVTEGDSAASMITDARDPETTAVLPQRGKLNNVYGKSVADLLKMEKISDLISAIGLIPGKKAIRSDLRYGKLIIATDADVDGGDIFTLFVNLFFHYWPELFDKNYEPFIYRLIAPNVCVTKGKNRIHFTARQEYEKSKTKFKSWTVHYYKGLGSMVRVDWEMVLSGQTSTLIPIVDDGKIKDVLKLLFSNDADARKRWLQYND